MDKKTIRVRAADGQRFPLIGGIAIDAGTHELTPETTVEVYWNRYTRRRLASGDWIKVDDDKPADHVLPTIELEGEAIDLSAAEAHFDPLPDGADVERTREPTRRLVTPRTRRGEEG